MFPRSLKQGSCSLVPYDIFNLFPCSPKRLGDPNVCQRNTRNLKPMMFVSFSNSAFYCHVFHRSLRVIWYLSTFLTSRHSLKVYWQRKFVCTSSDSRLVFLGFSEITECEKTGLVCSSGEVCKSQKDSGYTCACKDGFKKILLRKGKSACVGRNPMSR